MINRFFIYAFILANILTLEGCVLKNAGLYIQQTVKGEYYLTNKKYDEGRTTFLRSLKQNPDDVRANYYLGRIYLAENKGKEALNHLEKTVSLNPNKADYYFWLGVAQGVVGNSKLERQYYEKALSLYESHLQAMTYLGHKQLEEKHYTQSLKTYQKVLKIWPESPSALYNQALIMKKLERSPEEKIAWLNYLEVYPAGPMTVRAVDNLNKLGDFSYRNYNLGVRKITIRKIAFLPFSDKLDSSSYPSLDLLGAILKNTKKDKLQVVCYQKNNIELAKNRANSVKSYIKKKYPEIDKKRISLSWFDVPEEVNYNGEKYKIGESLRFFLTK